MTGLRFRNVQMDSGTPVEDWPFEGILAAVERGTIPDWRRLAAAVDADPWGPVARQIEEATVISRPYGATALFEELISDARSTASERERREVAEEIRALLARSGLTGAEFASRIGTSRTRVSTYLSGRVVPSAALMARMRRVAARGEA